MYLTKRTTRRPGRLARVVAVVAAALLPLVLGQPAYAAVGDTYSDFSFGMYWDGYFAATSTPCMAPLDGYVNGSAVGQAPCKLPTAPGNATPAQYAWFDDGDPGLHAIMSPDFNYCLDTKDGGTYVSVPVVIGICTGSVATTSMTQLWSWTVIGSHRYLKNLGANLCLTAYAIKDATNRYLDRLFPCVSTATNQWMYRDTYL